MKTGSIFNGLDIDKFEQWEKERATALSELVIKIFCETAGDKDSGPEFVHDCMRVLLLGAGYSEEGLQIWEALSLRSDHES